MRGSKICISGQTCRARLKFHERRVFFDFGLPSQEALRTKARQALLGGLGDCVLYEAISDAHAAQVQAEASDAE